MNLWLFANRLETRQLQRPVERKVVRVLTPGTITEDGLLDDDCDTLVIAILKDTKRIFGVAYLDINTAKFGGFIKTC